MNESGPFIPGGRLCWLMLWISIALLGFEISLMRLLLISSWYHFAFLVISIVLLGFGASGTLLTVFRRVVVARAEGCLFSFVLMTVVSMPLCTVLAQQFSVDARFVPALLLRQLVTWLVYWIVLAVPFLLGSATIVLSLMTARKNLPIVYAANLLGSGIGAILAPLMMLTVEPQLLSFVMAIPALVGALAFLSPRIHPAGVVPLIICLIVAVAALWLAPLTPRMDTYKYAAYLQRLEKQNEVECVARYHGPRAVIKAYRGDALHQMPFLSVGQSPPPISVITVDGHWAGTALRVDNAADASVVDQSLMSFAYQLAPRGPHVALLGEIGTTNIWLAARNSARVIDVVQPYPDVLKLYFGPIRDDCGAAFCLPAVQIHLTQPRQFIELVDTKYDVIQLAAIESSAAGSGGVGGLAQDFLLTSEGLSACLNALYPGGILIACRGIQTPPRDNVKLLATTIESLRKMGIDDPGKHIIIVRDYLAVCTVVKTTPWSGKQIESIRRVCKERELTPVWFEGIQPNELNSPDALAIAPDGIGDWYNYSARQLFSLDHANFIDAWSFDVRPPTDDRPFFFDMCRLSAIGALQRAYGDLWLTRTEIAYLFVISAAVLITLGGALFILLPLPWAHGVCFGSGRGSTIFYFGAIGLAYMLLEMTCLSRMTQLVGDPVISAAVTIAGFLVFSGLGCMMAQKAQNASRKTITGFFALIIVCGVIMLFMVELLLRGGGYQPLFLQCLVALFLIAPVACFMGIPMPLALRRLDRAAPATVPWAWAINSFASVLATPLTLIIAMSWGYQWAGYFALVLYAIAGVVFSRLPATVETRDK